MAKLASLYEQVAVKRLVEGAIEAVNVPQAKAQKLPAAGVRTRIGGLLRIVGFPQRSAVRRAFGNSRQRMLLVKALAEGELAALLAWCARGWRPVCYT